MTNKTVTEVKNNHIINIASVNCDICHKMIEVPIRKSDKDSEIGGIFRIVAIHQCLNEQIAFLLFFDDFLVLRQKVRTHVTLTDIHESDIFSEDQRRNLRILSGFNYLRKKLKDDLAKVIYGILINQQVVITGEKTSVIPSIESLEIFAKHRRVSIDSWTLDKSTADIIGTKPENAQFYFSSLIVDLENNIVFNGMINDYCIDFIKQIEDISDIETFTRVVEDELIKLIYFAKEFSLIQNFDEIEPYLSALVLEGVDENLLDAIIALSAQLNPFIAQYYRTNLDISDLVDSYEIKPYRLWIFDESNKLESFVKIQEDVPINFKEDLIIDRIERLPDQCDLQLNLFEYFTPLNHYILAANLKQKTLLCFPRFNEDNNIIANTLEFANDNLNKIQSDDNEYDIRQIIIHNWLNKKEDIVLSEQYISILDIRSILPTVMEQSILESYYFDTDINVDNLKQLITELIEMLSDEFKSEPKIIHNENLYTIKDVLKDLKADNVNNGDKIEL